MSIPTRYKVEGGQQGWLFFELLITHSLSYATKVGLVVQSLFLSSSFLYVVKRDLLLLL
jgi:hypothetical protein